MKPKEMFYKAHGLIFSFPAKNICRIQSEEACGAVQTIAAEFDGKAKEHREHLTVMQAETGNAVSLKPEGGHYSVFVSKKKFKAIFLNSAGQAVCTLVKAKVNAGKSSVSLNLDRKEHVFGLGQRFDGVSQRGKEFRIWAEDRWNVTEDNSYVPIPFFMSTAGYGLFMNRFEAATFNIGKKEPARILVVSESRVLDVYIFLSPDPKDITAGYTRLCGKTPLPPKWSFEPWICRHDRLKELATPEKVRVVMKKMEEHKFPWGVMLMEGWDTYNGSTYAGLKEITAELHSLGKKAMVYEACGRLNKDVWKWHDAKEKYFIKNLAGGVDVKEAPHFNPGDAPDRRTSVFLDVTDKEAVGWWLNTVWGKLLNEIRLDGAKIDFNEEMPEDGIKLKGLKYLKGFHQYYPVKYNILMYRNFNSKRPEGGVHFARGGGICSNRYHFIWMGDQSREWTRLKAIVSASLSAGISGIPFMAHDLGGYIPKREGIEDNETEVFARGTELAVFSPVVQIHGTVPWPYEFPEEIRAIYRFYMELRYEMLPYITDQAKKCVKEGLPLMRHLYLEYAHNKRVRSVEDQYMFGENLLVAPVLGPVDKRDIYIPEGDWMDIWTGKRIKGPCELKGFEAKLDRIPVFAKAKAVSSPAIKKILLKTMPTQ
ncbi:MAG: hypothetical protein KJ964_06560 [Verrucomicrobia bacterium]|nr:hypothetical protein [Verrucomicrobiota bacterium]MBU1735093.1 hypothetical protein [Verrucomicrobiota bacterium]MBU1856391.1 hypothetical protein [Verrucomicrobiota bacterium]